MPSEWSSWLERWSGAGLIDSATADRIRAFEAAHGGAHRMRWPIRIALAFGGLMLGGGLLLFVAAHWDALSPATRFGIVLLTVGGLHAAGALTGDRFPAMGSTFHAIGTIALGSGIALAGQIFNLDEHWPGGIMLWALGAGLAAWVIRDTAQIALFALLAPAWLVAEWTEAYGLRLHSLNGSIVAGGCVFLALTYFTAPTAQHRTHVRRALMWIGGLAFPPCAAWLAFGTADRWTETPSGPTLLALGMVVGVTVPGVLAVLLHGARAWHHLLALAWIVTLVVLHWVDADLALYGWWALAAIGLTAWGVKDGRTERINMGAALFAATVGAFYFSEVMDKLGRSASLIGLGLLFLGGGWALEQARRRLVTEARGER